MELDLEGAVIEAHLRRRVALPETMTRIAVRPHAPLLLKSGRLGAREAHPLSRLAAGQLGRHSPLSKFNRFAPLIPNAEGGGVLSPAVGGLTRRLHVGFNALTGLTKQAADGGVDELSGTGRWRRPTRRRHPDESQRHHKTPPTQHTTLHTRHISTPTHSTHTPQAAPKAHRSTRLQRTL